MRELGAASGLSSTSSVNHQIGALVKKGALRRDPRRPRAYSLTAAGEQLLQDTSWAYPEQYEEAEAVTADTVHAPLVGRIAAGVPILAEQHTTDTLAVPRQLVGRGHVRAYRRRGVDDRRAHRVGGHSDRPASSGRESGEIVAALLGDGEATAKRCRRDGAHVWLVAENPDFSPLCGDQATILGKVVMVMRSL